MSFDPRLPYLHVPDLVLLPKGALGNFPPAPFSLKPFGTLVAIGVYLGAWLAIKQGKRLGLDERKLMSFIVWVVGFGFVAELTFLHGRQLLGHDDVFALVQY